MCVNEIIRSIDRPRDSGFIKAVVKIYEMIEEIIRTCEQGEKVQGQDVASPVHVRARDDLPRGLATYPVISSDKLSRTKYSKGFKNVYGNPYVRTI